MLQKKKPDVDVIMDLLKETLTAYPESVFVKSLLYQYQERGGLSKKQLEGLYGKASKLTSVTHGKLATLEAIILKKSSRHKSPMPAAIPPVVKDETIGRQIEAILGKYPLHKRVLFYKVKYQNNDIFSPAEKTELEKFHKLLIK
jgi:hypothetical protein